jgi:hypothetical protein
MVKLDVREHYDLRYVRKQRGSLYWKPRPKDCEAYHFKPCNSLGRDGPEAWRKGDAWNKRLDRARRGESEPEAPQRKEYRDGTLGSFFNRFRRTPKWETMSARTHEDYWRAWDVIEPRYGDVLINRITAIESERFHLSIHPVHNKNRLDPARLTWAKAWRVLKGWRGLLNAMEDYGVVTRAPIGRISNPAPKGRTQRWTHDEVVLLIDGAWAMGCKGMSCALAVTWDTLFSPGDARLVSAAEWKRDAEGAYIETDRLKTGKAVLAPISDATAKRVARYLGERDATPTQTAPLFKSRTGRDWKDHKEFGKEFRLVREHVFPGDARQFLDLRRSGNTEAWVGGEDRENLAKALGNRLDKNDRLWETYTPPTLAAAREVQAARTIGRARLKANAKPD